MHRRGWCIEKLGFHVAVLRRRFTMGCVWSDSRQLVCGCSQREHLTLSDPAVAWDRSQGMNSGFMERISLPRPMHHRRRDFVGG